MATADQIDYRKSFFESLSQKRGNPSGGGLPLNFLELFDTRIVTYSFTEPDALTSRTEYFYNTRTNVLHKRKKINSFHAIWQPMNLL